MKNETIQEIVMNDQNELLLKLIGDGKPMYQYIYREAAGVYWDDSQKGFKSTPIQDWTVFEWFFHIVDTVESGLGVVLEMDVNPIWKNIPQDEIIKIKSAQKRGEFPN